MFYNGYKIVSVALRSLGEVEIKNLLDRINYPEQFQGNPLINKNLKEDAA